MYVHRLNFLRLGIALVRVKPKQDLSKKGSSTIYIWRKGLIRSKKELSEAIKAIKTIEANMKHL